MFFLFEPVFRPSETVYVGPVGAQVELTSGDLFLLANAAIPCELVRRRPLVVREVRAMLAERRANACLPNDQLDKALDLQPAIPNKRIWLSPLLSTFMHANFAHVAGNMFFLFVLGNNVEDRLGRPRYLLLYFVSGAASWTLHIAVLPHSTLPSLGASGAVAGVLGAFLVLFPFARILTLLVIPFPLLVYLPAFVPLTAWFLLQFTPLVGANVARFAHVGGFLAGALLSPLLLAASRPAKPPLLRKGPVYLNVRAGV